MTENPLIPQQPATTGGTPLALLLAHARERTPARLLVGRAGAAYTTPTQLALRQDHAAARDAVRSELELSELGSELVTKFGLFETQTAAVSKTEYLLRPDAGRRFSTAARSRITERCPARPGLQIVVGDGLSATAVRVQAPVLLPLLAEAAAARGWQTGQMFVVRYCRVGLLNEIGDLLDPEVAVLLIGERPGLATAESLSAYMAWRPKGGQTDAHRNLISNIHSRGVSPAEATQRILQLAEQMRACQASGVAIKEQFTGRVEPPAPGTLDSQ